MSPGGGLVLFGANDNGFCPGASFQSRLVFTFKAGVEYFIVVVRVAERLWREAQSTHMEIGIEVAISGRRLFFSIWRLQSHNRCSSFSTASCAAAPSTPRASRYQVSLCAYETGLMRIEYCDSQETSKLQQSSSMSSRFWQSLIRPGTTKTIT